MVFRFLFLPSRLPFALTLIPERLFLRFRLAIFAPRFLLWRLGLALDLISLLRRLLHQRQEMRCQNGVAHVVDGHVPVDAVVGELVGHDATGGVVDEDV